MNGQLSMMRINTMKHELEIGKTQTKNCLLWGSVLPVATRLYFPCGPCGLQQVTNRTLNVWLIFFSTLVKSSKVDSSLKPDYKPLNVASQTSDR